MCSGRAFDVRGFKTDSAGYSDPVRRRPGMMREVSVYRRRLFGTIEEVVKVCSPSAWQVSIAYGNKMLYTTHIAPHIVLLNAAPMP